MENNIMYTIYEQVPQPFEQEDFYTLSPNIIRMLAKEEEWNIPKTDKFYINYN